MNTRIHVSTHRAALLPIAALLVGLALLLSARPAAANQEDSRKVPITGDRISGFVLPIEPIQSDISLRALRAWAWQVDDTQRLLLQGDVAITIGAYAFQSKDAVVWLNRIPSAQGVVNQIAIYFEHVGDPTKQAGLGAGGDQLLVTGSARGEVKLNVALLEQTQPPPSKLLTSAQNRLADYLKKLVAQPPDLEQRPQTTAPAAQPPFVPVLGGSLPAKPEEKLPGSIDMPPTQQQAPWLAGPEGTVRFSAEHVEFSRQEQENVITATGGLVVEVISGKAADAFSRLTLTAERGVIFTDPGPLVSGENQMDAGKVRGVYLEGNVTATTHNGEYSIRAPRVYYDFRSQQAIMVDSLLRVQPRDFQLPIYARAHEMRQVAEDQWEANRVTVSTSEFATPHLAIGSQKAIITRRTPAEAGDRAVTHLDARDDTLRVLDVPVFYWPRVAGDAENFPIRNVNVGTRSHDGVRILTTWDLLSLAGVDAPQGVEADLKVDGFTKRGAGIGTELRYNVAECEGKVDLYGLYDTGIDRTSSGIDVDPMETFRGVALLEHQMQLSQFWSLQAQLSYISDETFITTWREDDFAERREYETSLYLKHQRDNAALTFLGKYSLEEFISNSYLLAGRAYSVDKMPEITYRRYGDSFFDDTVTYSTENRLSRMSLVFEQGTPNSVGVRPGAFGIGPNDSIFDLLFTRGLREGWVNRFDSRHELAMPLHPGIFNVTPFIVGRFTGYDKDFDSFSSDSDSMRFFGAAGVRINTQFQRVNNNVENQTLDLHRLRHLVEPYITLWTAYSNVSQDDMPIYDEEVESIADGSAVQVGVRNTLQTQRGGPGQWRSVNWLTLDTSVVFDTEGKPNESPTPQFFEFRPEYSQFGDHVRAQGTLLLSDTLTLGGDAIYALDDPMFARGAIGMEIRHSPVFSTFIEYRYIEANKSELLDVGWQYQLTPKYRVALTPQWDFREGQFRALSLRVTRAFPDFDLIFIVRYDEIRDDTLIGASLGLARF